MALLLLAFIAGVLTVAAPCILPLLPIVIGGSLGNPNDHSSRFLRPIVITLSLAVSVIAFTLLLKGSTALLGVPLLVWQIISAAILVILGLHFIFPTIWERISSNTKLYTKTNAALGKTIGKQGVGGAVLTGFALGPVFNSCSPTYLFIVATVLPASFLQGFAYIIAYALGLSFALLLVALAGQSIVQKLGWLSNPSGNFRRILGVIFIAVGLFVLFGIDKKLQTYILDNGWYAPISELEQKLK